MGRTGQSGPGSSKAFKYGKGQLFANEAAAVKAAELWKESELKCSIPPKHLKSDRHTAGAVTGHTAETFFACR